MKLFEIFKISLGAMGICSILLSCTRDIPEPIATIDTDFTASSFVQVYNASIPSAATDPRKNYVFVNGTPVTGAAVGYGSLFPAVGPGVSILSGSQAFLIKDTLPSATQPQLSFSPNLESTKHYTVFMYDTFNVIKQKVVQTNIEIPDDTTSRVRFANFAYYPTATAGIDIFSKARNAYVVQNLLSTQVTEFIPYASAVSDTLYVYEAGNPTNKLDTLNGFFPTRLRSYTLIFRGRWRTNEAGSAANPRVLTSFPNN
ncbi:MAG TPA: hypothetical protein VGQ09_03215 [Chitinophagaceae bacterium]|jgi:hypothetical protein|nr:hypothetical protein [Chitinophagaceae bacterium]